MPPSTLVGIIEATFDYFIALGKWRQDPEGGEAVRRVKDGMIEDLGSFDQGLTHSEVDDLCRTWRSQRIEFTEEAAYPPDMFIESVCEAVAIT